MSRVPEKLHSASSLWLHNRPRRLLDHVLGFRDGAKPAANQTGTKVWSRYVHFQLMKSGLRGGIYWSSHGIEPHWGVVSLSRD